MKKPSLRFRQVFEHPTHFKVTKPLGNPLIIAKKGLSPSLQTRLRKFAQGGEVRGYQAGGEVADTSGGMSDADFQSMLADIRGAKAPDLTYADESALASIEPQYSREEALEPFSYRMDMGSRGEAADPFDYKRLMGALSAIKPDEEEPEKEAKPTPVLPMGTPEQIIDAEIQRELAKPNPDQSYIAALRVRKAELQAEAQPAAPAKPGRAISSTPELAPIETPAAPPAVAAPTAAAPVAVQPPPARRAQFEIGKPEVVAPSVKPAPVAAPVVPVAAAPTVEPVKPVVPVVEPAPVAAPVAPPAPPAPPAQIVAPEKVAELAAKPKEITVDSLQALMKQNPGVPPAKLALELVRSAMPQTEPSEDLKAQTLGVLKDMRGEQLFTEGLATRLSGIVGQANAERVFAEKKADAVETALAERLVVAEKNKQTLAALGERRKTLESAVEKGFQPKSFFGRMDTDQRIASMFALALGGFSSSFAGTPDYIYKAFNDAIDRDVDSQKNQYKSIVNQYARVLNDYEAAEKLTKADLIDLSAQQMKAIEARQASAKVTPAALEVIGKLQMDASKLREEVAASQAEADIKRIDAKLREREKEAEIEKDEATAKAKGTGLALSAARYELALERFRDAQKRREDASEFVVPNPADPAQLITVKTRDPADGRAARKEINQRVTALSRVEELDDLLKQKRSTQQALSPAEVARVRLLTNEIIENYPSLTKGTTQLVTVAQSRLLKDSTGDVPVPYAKWGNLAGMSGAAIAKMREEGTKVLKASVNNYARPDDAGAAEFNARLGPKGFSGKIGELTGKPATAAVRQNMVLVSKGSEQFWLPRSNLKKAIDQGYVEVKK